LLTTRPESRLRLQSLITDGDGKAVEIEGKHPHVGYLGKRRCYVDGAFSLAARATPLTIELRHGQGWGGTNGRGRIGSQRVAPPPDIFQSR